MGRETIDPNYRRIADRFENILKFSSHAPLEFASSVPRNIARVATLGIVSNAIRIKVFRQSASSSEIAACRKVDKVCVGLDIVSGMTAAAYALILRDTV